MKKKIIAAALLFAVIAGICLYSCKTSKNTADKLTLFGNIEIRQVDLSFQVSGMISELLKEEGDVVRKGELVAVLDESDYALNFKRAEAEVASVLAMQKEASDKYKRYAPLENTNIFPKQEIESIKHVKNRTEAEYRAAVANRDYIGNQLKYTRLYAPDDGIITVRVQETGSYVQKGQAVYSMAKTNPVWVRAYINEKDLGNTRYGQSVNVYTDTVNPQTGRKREYKGQIGYISPVAEFTPKTVQSADTRTSLVYRIRVYINNADDYLRQGMPVTINVDLNSEGNTGNNADGNN